MATALLTLGAGTPAEVGEAATLPTWSVGQRLAERPDWFAADGERWKLTAAGEAAAREGDACSAG